jgi:hypothetical protein
MTDFDPKRLRAVRLARGLTTFPPTDADVLLDLYGLTPEQSVVWLRLGDLIDEALEQFEKGYAVDVERHMADIAKQVCP